MWFVTDEIKRWLFASDGSYRMCAVV